jgi:hypothetical protein
MICEPELVIGILIIGLLVVIEILVGTTAGVQVQSDDGLYLEGMFSEANYPERSMNGSVRAGYETAGAVVRDV